MWGMKEDKLKNYINEQLKKQGTGNKSIDGRLFDSYGADLADFPKEIVDHVEKFTGENLEAWVEELYRLMSDWLETARWGTNLADYLRKTPIKDFVGGFYLALLQHVIQRTSGFAKAVATLNLANVLGRINLDYYSQPLPAGASLITTIANPFMNPFKKEEIFSYIKGVSTGLGFVLSLAKNITEDAALSASDLKDILSHLTELQREELLENIAGDFHGANFDTHFQTEANWDIMVNIINLLVSCDKLDDQQFKPLMDWLSTPQNIGKLTDKIVSHKNFAELSSVYRKSEHPIAQAATKTFLLNGLLDEKPSPAIIKAPSLPVNPLNQHPTITQYKASVESAKTKDELNELALLAKSTLLMSEPDPKKQQQLLELIDDIGRTKIATIQSKEIAPAQSKAEASNFLKGYMEKHPHIVNAIKYVAYSAAGLLAAKILLPTAIVAAIGKLGVMGVRALLTTTAGHTAAAGIAGAGAALAAGLFRQKSVRIEEKDTQQKIAQIVVAATGQAMTTSAPASAAADIAELTKQKDNPAALLSKVIQLIETRHESAHELGEILADKLKNAFGMEKLTTEDLLGQLKQLSSALEKNPALNGSKGQPEPSTLAMK